MFNNPFESFHDTVAEAKEEREQLDRLLIISTPRERVLLMLVIVTVFAFASWLVFGTVSQRISVEGVVGAIEGQAKPSKTVQVLVLGKTDRLEAVEAGMAAVVRFHGSLDGVKAISGRVNTKTEITIAPVTGTMESTALSVPRLDVLADSLHDLSPESLVGEKCLLVVEIGRQSPIQLIGAGLF